MDITLQLEEDIRKYNIAYRNGEAIISDAEYDALVDELRDLNPDSSIFNEIGYIAPTDDRKEQLIHPMYSMEKIKTVQELQSWLKSKNIAQNEIMCITPKYDGASFLSNEKTGDGWTRGDGQFGQRSKEHFSYIKQGKLDKNLICIGEMIMKVSVFEEKYSDIYKNPRNFVAGLFNTKNAEEKKHYFADVDFIRYGVITDNPAINTKHKEIQVVNKFQEVQVPYVLIPVNEITEEYTTQLFNEWSKDYEIDGVIVEVNDYEVRNRLGRERNNNPCYARAFKGEFEEKKETKVLGFSDQISRTGKLKPVVHIEPITLNGVTVRKATAYNARYLKIKGIGIGSIIVVKRSGMVIPKIIDVLSSTGYTMPDIPNIRWDDNGVDLIMGGTSREQEIKQIAHFFKCIGVDELGEGISKILYDAGLTDIKKIMNATKHELIQIHGLGEKKALTIIKKVNEKLKNIPIHVLQTASGFFNLLAEKKLKLFAHFTEKPEYEELIKIEGIGDKNAKIYLENYDKFINFAKELNIQFVCGYKEEKVDGIMNEIGVCFTGIRDKELELFITNNGGTICSGVSKECTHLVCKDPNENSSKIKKAKQNNIKILTLQQFKELW